ncbi:uncharacterized protein LOC34624178 [Cyclospora cayetanensis]|uniref:GRA9 protein n=2 Tax=Cyclospora cayetanensis TaxID=88456 RepID=A0A1D3D9N9_9EIME|nr:uncharacterized protein LOC34624178 [Cyclospora cayetanensis]OEH80155.1 putative GRA9 protein [Cyclospora cayetanensis]
MQPLLVRCGAVAALLAVQLGVSYSVASEEKHASDSGQQGNVGFPSLFDGSAFAGIRESIEQSVSSFLNMMGPMETMLQEGPLLSLAVQDGNEESCYMKVTVGKSGPSMKDVKIGLNPTSRAVTILYDQQQDQRTHDPEKGDSVSSRAVHVTSSLSLPSRCMASASVLLLGLAGYMVDSSGSRGRIIFPSSKLLNKYAEEGLLPKDIIGTIENGDQAALSALPPEQQCLAAGFTTEDCAKLNSKPVVASVAAAGLGLLPIPLYVSPLELLE